MTQQEVLPLSVYRRRGCVLYLRVRALCFGRHKFHFGSVPKEAVTRPGPVSARGSVGPHARGRAVIVHRHDTILIVRSSLRP